MNNADLTVVALRELQAISIDKNTSPAEIFKKIDHVIIKANKASKQINDVEATLNRIINVLDQKNMFNGDVVAAFTGLDKQKSEELSKNLVLAKKEIIK